MAKGDKFGGSNINQRYNNNYSGWTPEVAGYVSAVQDQGPGMSGYWSGIKNYQNRQAIEWANQQKMSDPAYWAQAFGMGSGSGSGGGGYSQPAYEDTAAQYRTRLNSLMDNPDSIANTGAYKFAFNQGQEGVNRSLAAKGLLKSGNRLSELTKFGQGLASQQYGAEFDRMSNLVNTTRAGDISKYGTESSAATARYGVEQQGQNQLRALLMKNMLDNQQKPTQYGFGRSSGGGASAQTYNPTANLANPAGMWTMNPNTYDPETRQGMYTNSLTGQQQMRSGW